MPSSTSSLSVKPAVSVVIGANAPTAALDACLSALEPQREGVEVLVCSANGLAPELRDRFSWARFLERPGALVPELWRDGIDASEGEIVALTIAQMVPAPNWVAVLRGEHARNDVVAGAIDPGRSLRISDWGEYFCRYAADMRPFAGHECLALPGDNAAYKRALLERTHDLYRDGFWEPEVHRRLAADGIVLWHEPELVVYQGRSAGWWAFVRQRLAHGRAYGRQRGARFGPARNAAGVLSAPLVPFLMTARVLRQVLAKRRHRVRALLALPAIISFNAAWAAAEARGHIDALAGR